MATSQYGKWLAIQKARRAQIKASYASGMSLKEVAALYGISRGRVHQIVHKPA